MLCPECRTPCSIPMEKLPRNVILNRILEGMGGRKESRSDLNSPAAEQQRNISGNVATNPFLTPTAAPARTSAAASTAASSTTTAAMTTPAAVVSATNQKPNYLNLGHFSSSVVAGTGTGAVMALTLII
jgi:hypothetical protein